MSDIYNPDFVTKLFDEMSDSYDRVNYLTSFGFSSRWRKQCINKAAIEPGMVVYDLTCGMGECWHTIAENLANDGQLFALDFSQGMLKGAERRKQKLPNLNIALQQQDILSNTLENNSADCIISVFGLKTFSDEQKRVFAAEIKRILKPQGTFSLIEVSVPDYKPLRVLYMFYLKQIIPILGKIFLGNPENYRMLGVYTEAYGNSKRMEEILSNEGLMVNYHDFFYGCASGISGVKL